MSTGWIVVEESPSSNQGALLLTHTALLQTHDGSLSHCLCFFFSSLTFSLRLPVLLCSLSYIDLHWFLECDHSSFNLYNTFLSVATIPYLSLSLSPSLSLILSLPVFPYPISLALSPSPSLSLSPPIHSNSTMK